MADKKLTIKPFEKALHDRGAFSSGVDAMDRWLRESISEQIKQNRIRLWCATAACGAFVGYYALAMHAVAPEDAPNLARSKERNPIPAIYLAALAVDLKHQGRGIGGALLADALERCARLADEIGAAAIVLDVLEDGNYDRRRAFYTGLGFTVISEAKPARLYLTIQDVKASLTVAR